MWVAKSEEEILAGKQSGRWSVLWAAVGLWAVVLSFAAVSAVLAGRPAGEWILPVHGFLGPVVLDIMAFALALGTVRWLRRSRANKSDTWICQKCNRVKNCDGQATCDCGGSFLALDDMKWVQNPPPATTPPSQPPIASLSCDPIRAEQ
jgi:hypothetical protein